MTAVSRQHMISLERLRINYRVMPEQEMPKMKFIANKKGSKSFFMHGLYLYGAKWDPEKQTICDLDAKDNTGNPMPFFEMTIEDFNPLNDIDLQGKNAKDVKGKKI